MISPELSIISSMLIGGVAVPAINTIKSIVKSSNPKINLAIAFGVSLVLAVLALVITGAFSGNPITAQQIVSWLTTIFTVATIIYKGTATTPVDPANQVVK
jgi:uncharacterized membrane protein